MLVALIVLALIGVAFVAVPASPAHRPVKQGLDLQGGLEYVLKAQPPKGHKLTADDLDRSVSIMRDRVDKLGVAEPIITKQGKDQISIQLAGVHNVAEAANIIGSTAQLELYDLEPALFGPVDLRVRPGRERAASTSCSRACRPSAKNGTPSQYVLFKPVKVTTTTGVGKNKKTTTKTVYVKAAKPFATATLHRDSNGNPGILDRFPGGKLPKGYKILTVPAKTVLISCYTPKSRRLPGRSGRRAAVRQVRLLPLQERARTRTTATRRTASTRT